MSIDYHETIEYKRERERCKTDRSEPQTGAGRHAVKPEVQSVTNEKLKKV